MFQVCTLRWFSETEICIHLKPFPLSFRLTRCSATVFLQIIQFACFHVYHWSAVYFDANTWRCSIMYCSCGFILQSICSRYISCPLHWSVYSFAPHIFLELSLLQYPEPSYHHLLLLWGGVAGHHKSAESLNSVKMASKKCKDHCRHKDCFGENLCVRNFCSVPSPPVCVVALRMLPWPVPGCRMTDLTFRDGIYDWLQSVVVRHDCCVLRPFDDTL
jgi:hypothetical protein